MFYFVTSLMAAVFGAAVVYVEFVMHGTLTGWAIFFAAYSGVCLLIAIAVYTTNKSHKAGW